MSQPLYSIGTWDTYANAFTEQDGLEAPSFNVDWRGLLRVLRELKTFGYSCHSIKDPESGDRTDSDPSVLVERTDGRDKLEILADWRGELWTI